MIISTKRRWLLLAVVSAGLLLITLDNSILYAALPTLVEDLGASSSEGLWIINAYPVVMAGLLLGSGTLGDRVGHRRMFLIGLVVFGAASLFAAFSTSPEALIAARAFLAVGAAAMMPATLALIRVTFDDERERNMAIAVWGTMAVVGSALGPIISGILLQHFWWGSVFIINIPVVLVAVVATLFVAPRDTPDPSKRWDLLSSLLALVALVGLVIAIKETAKAGPAPAVIATAVLAAAIGGWAFARRQRRLPYPLLDFAIFRNRAFLAGVLSAGFALFAIAGVQLVTTQRFQLVEGFTPLRAGYLVAAVALGAFPTAMLGGDGRRRARRRRPRDRRPAATPRPRLGTVRPRAPLSFVHHRASNPTGLRTPSISGHRPSPDTTESRTPPTRRHGSSSCAPANGPRSSKRRPVSSSAKASRASPSTPSPRRRG